MDSLAKFAVVSCGKNIALGPPLEQEAQHRHPHKIALNSKSQPCNGPSLARFTQDSSPPGTITCLVRNPYKPLFATATGEGRINK